MRQKPVQAESRARLRELLQVASGGVVFTTVQKFFPEERGDAHPCLSQRRNIVVIADVVEFHPVDDGTPGGIALSGQTGRWQPFPVEYKRGRRKAEISYLVQLCAQALCLEEMLGVTLPAGALYHGKSRRRQQVAFDATLRARTQIRAHELHELIATGKTPPPARGPKCKFCSLAARCLPKLSPSRSARRYLTRAIEDLLTG